MDRSADSNSPPSKFVLPFETPVFQDYTAKRQANKAIRQYLQGYDTVTIESSASNGGTGADWVDIPEIPTKEELMALDGNYKEGMVVLRPNRISKPWESTKEYLEAHYRLLREDTIAPLRDAIAWIRTSPNMLDKKDVFVYEKVHFTRMTMTTRGIAFRARFSTRRAKRKIPWKYSPRLIPGSLVALSGAKDCFRTQCVVATVAARPLERVINYPPEIDIYFANPDDIEIDSQKEWIMVESHLNYFESSRHTLTALQKLAGEKFPLNRHICHLDKDVEVSSDIELNPVLSFQPLTRALQSGSSFYNVLHDLPTEPLGNLNQLQWQALKSTLTKQLVLVQGPPGTGKTHVSVMALQVLLSNMVTGVPPIVVAAHTNHALDQLIRQIATFEKNYVRLGGRSNDIDIRQRTLHSIKLTQKTQSLIGGLLGPARKELHVTEMDLVELLQLFKNERTCSEPLTAADFLEYGLLTRQQVKSLQNDDKYWENVSSETEDEAEPFKFWLRDQIFLFQPVYEGESDCFTIDDIDAEYEQLRELETEQGPQFNKSGELKGRALNIVMSFRGKQRASIAERKIEQYLRTPDLCKIPIHARGAIYNHLRAKLLQILQERVRNIAKDYAKASTKLFIGNCEQNYEILRNAKLVAMTTTGLSKYRGLVASLNPRVVLIEEAAEVIEAPVVVACFESIQQLILVGDHKQLRGQCSLFDLTGDPFHLDVSMFERLTRNHLPFVLLKEQRRMIPGVSDLLKPIYGQLENHSSVHEYPSIPGMGDTKSFFFSHHWPENGDSLSSKIIDVEAFMLVEFYVYLLMNGTPASLITVMTFYNGQRKLLLKTMRDHKSLAYLSPKVMTVDSYQGEENDIVLLSLVRSNSDQGIGFLAVDNRVCVALSRAKRGFFLFGNAELLSSMSPLWNEVIKNMASDPKKTRIGQSLQLTCQNHGNHTEVTVPGDWHSLNGGCHLPCKETMKCGHTCSLKCHGYSHNMIFCDKPCSYVRPCCYLACTAICGSLHVHDCECISEVKTMEAASNSMNNVHLIESDDEPDDEPVPGHKSAIVSARKSQEHHANSSNGNLQTFRSGNKQFVTAAHQRWNAFSDGGAKEMDKSLHLLLRAEDLGSEEVKWALGNVHPKFLPKNFLARMEGKTRIQQANVGEAKRQETKTDGPSVTEGILIDLSF